jgi:hypothetical protein
MSVSSEGPSRQSLPGAEWLIPDLSKNQVRVCSFQSLPRPFKEITFRAQGATHFTIGSRNFFFFFFFFGSTRV